MHRICPLGKREALHAPTALDELDDDAVLIESLLEIIPGPRRVDGREDRRTNSYRSSMRRLTLRSSSVRRRARASGVYGPKRRFERPQCTTRVDP